MAWGRWTGLQLLSAKERKPLSSEALVTKENLVPAIVLQTRPESQCGLQALVLPRSIRSGSLIGSEEFDH